MSGYSKYTYLATKRSRHYLHQGNSVPKREERGIRTFGFKSKPEGCMA